MASKGVVRRRMATRRRRRVRSKINGTGECPRLTVHKTLKNVVAQIVNDVDKVTLVGVASNSKAMTEVIVKEDTKTAAAKKVGQKIAELAKDKGIETVVFDRNQYRYHGRIKAVAEGAREGGLKF
ncbi:50S ribosomal protein L18 [candidate division GN15 bacterium]|nr:50S ribosomal protein L18 [candidate division GN15 bacterium]